jgi:hypothetical protein
MQNAVTDIDYDLDEWNSVLDKKMSDICGPKGNGGSFLFHIPKILNLLKIL